MRDASPGCQSLTDKHTNLGLIESTQKTGLSSDPLIVYVSNVLVAVGRGAQILKL